MVHDLNNINQAILSAFEILIYNPDVSSKLKDQVQLGLEQVERSTALIGRVKKFSGIDNIQPVMQIRDIEPDFQAALETVKQGFPHKIIHLDTNIYPDTFKVLADDLLEDLLFNLIHNAVKFDHRERVNLQVKVHSDENKRFLRLEIIDHGPGIPDDLKERIFARYTQQDSIKAQGSGIGLTLVQRIVGRYSGKVWVEDRVEGDHTKGSKFVLLLPKWN